MKKGGSHERLSALCVCAWPSAILSPPLVLALKELLPDLDAPGVGFYPAHRVHPGGSDSVRVLYPRLAVPGIP